MKEFSISEKGKRAENEDFLISKVLGGAESVHIVADGMGGYEHGAVVSKKVSELIIQYLQKQTLSEHSIENIIRDAVQYSNKCVQELSAGFHSKMGATVAGLILFNQQAYAFWVGDVRIYHFRCKKIIFESTDHSIISQLIASGQVITPGIRQLYGHIVTRSIQGKPVGVEPDIVKIPDVFESDKFIICSDGVHNVIASSQLEFILNSQDDSEEVIKSIKTICDKDGKDNYSMILVSMENPLIEAL